MDKVTELNPAGQVDVFFKKMFGTHRGFVYAPVTAPNNAADWQPYWFKWPQDADKLTDHIISSRTQKEVYYSPVLFKEPDLTKDSLHGSQYLWVEFNGETPTPEMLKDIPSPTMKVRTSEVGHEYWLWDISFFETDFKRVDDAIKRLALALKGDMSVWHHENVLRCPNTIHHRTGLGTFITETNENLTTLGAFDSLTQVPQYLTEENFANVPNVQNVIAIYKWKYEDWKFFLKKIGDGPNDIPIGKRFSALSRLAKICAEMGMDNPEMLSILLQADKRWKHFSDRNPEKQRARLIGLINHVRITKPLKAYSDLADEFPDYGFKEFIALELVLEWAIEDLVEKAGLMMVTGDSGTGKTRWILSLCAHLALGRDFLIWKVNRPMKMVFFSLEMNAVQLKFFMDQMVATYNEEDQKLLQENFIIVPLGQSNNMDKPAWQPKTTAKVEKHMPDGVIVDSLGVAMQADVTNQEVVNRVLDYVNVELRGRLGAFVAFIHHHRKHGDGKPGRDDIFGSGYLINQMSTIVTLHRPIKGGPVTVTNPKLRMAPGGEFKPFRIQDRPGSIEYDLIGKAGVKEQTKAELMKKVVKGEIAIEDLEEEWLELQ